MLVKTKVFKLCDGKYENLSKLAQVMGISVSQVYRVREGKRNINQKFIVGAIKAFPGHKLDDLFYLVPDSPAVTYHPDSAMLLQMSQPASRNREGKVLSKY